MRLYNVLKDTEFDQYIDVFASKGYYTIEELQTLENDPENYIRVLSEVEPDDFKMMDLFRILETASENEKQAKIEAEKEKKKKKVILFYPLILVILASPFVLKLFSEPPDDDNVVFVTPVKGGQNGQPTVVETEFDSDEDGILDVDDDCVYEFGPQENNGCPWPDSDSDGVVDKDDACVSDYGPVENDGCPWPDSDGDGVLDKDDDCVSDHGPEENNGCPWPDSDNDGVLDKDDDCPYEYGSRYDNGCPKVTAAAHSFKISNEAGRSIPFYLKVDGGSWEKKTLDNDYFNTYKYSKSSIKWKLTTAGHSPLIYDINSAEEYVIKWNDSKGVWDLYRR